MAVTWTATGITASSDTTSPFANLSYTLPTGHTTNDLLIAFYGGKPYNTVPSTPADYTAQSGGANGSTGMGAGTGSVYAVAFTKIHDGSESNPASTFSAQYSPGIRAMVKATDSSGLGTWLVASCKGSDATATSTTFSATGDATLALQPGDWLVALYVHNDDSSSSSSFALSVPGCTLDTVTQRLTGTLTTATGNDGRMYVVTAEVLSGTASGAPTATCTTGSGDSDGQVVFLLVRPPIVGESALSATADLSADASVIATHTASASLSSTGELSGTATVLATHTATAALSSSASLTGSGVVVDSTTGTLSTATASLTAAGVVVDAATASLSSSASLTSSATVEQSAVEASASLSASAALSGAGVVVDSGGAALAASAALTATATREVGSAATLAATAALTTTSARVAIAEAVLSAAATLAAEGSVTVVPGLMEPATAPSAAMSGARVGTPTAVGVRAATASAAPASTASVAMTGTTSTTATIERS